MTAVFVDYLILRLMTKFCSHNKVFHSFLGTFFCNQNISFIIWASSLLIGTMAHVSVASKSFCQMGLGRRYHVGIARVWRCLDCLTVEVNQSYYFYLFKNPSFFFFFIFSNTYLLHCLTDIAKADIIWPVLIAKRSLSG